MQIFWPVPVMGVGVKPRISDGFGEDKRDGRGHYGADIMFPRAEKGEFDRPQYTPLYMMPNGTPCLAMAHGKVIRVGEGRTGKFIEIDHGERWTLGRATTLYRHLAETHVTRGQEIMPGVQIGVCGKDPTNGERGINHLHFELWDRDRPGGPRLDIAYGIDPAPLLAKCAYRYMDGRQLVADGGDIGVVSSGGWDDASLAAIQLATLGLIPV